jgi:hypothetical protein
MDNLVAEAAIHERLGLRVVHPVFAGSLARRVNLQRFNLNGTIYLRRADIVNLLKTESEALGGDPVLDRLADTILKVTQ